MLGAMSARMTHPNLELDGHWDPQARLRDMDSDGVAAELIWHFSQNGENLPWIGQGLGTVFKHQFELGAVAYEIYNRWLADFCSEDAERLLGLVYIPSWDIDASIKTLEWARENGLRCLNFPAPSRPGVDGVQRSRVGPVLVCVHRPRLRALHALERRPVLRLHARPRRHADHRVRRRELAGASRRLDPHVRRGVPASSRSSSS